MGPREPPHYNKNLGIISLMSTKLALLLTIPLLVLSVLTYSKFNKFKPKSIVPVEEVHGVKYEPKVNLPLPNDNNVIGSIKTGITDQKTYETQLSPEDVQTYYKNILLSKDWELKSDSKVGIFLVSDYEKNGSEVIITSSQQENTTTIVSVRINY